MNNGLFGYTIQNVANREQNVYITINDSDTKTYRCSKQLEKYVWAFDHEYNLALDRQGQFIAGFNMNTNRKILKAFRSPHFLNVIRIGR